MFRPTGQNAKSTSASSMTDALSQSTEQFSHASPRPRQSTFSEDEEEERTAGSGVDLNGATPGEDENTTEVPAKGGVEERSGRGNEDGETVRPDVEVDKKAAVDADNVEDGSKVSQFGIGKGTKEENVQEKSDPGEVGVAKDADSKEGVVVDEGDKEMQELLRVNPTYAKYVLERRKQAEELRLRSKFITGEI